MTGYQVMADGTKAIGTSKSGEFEHRWVVCGCWMCDYKRQKEQKKFDERNERMRLRGKSYGNAPVVVIEEEITFFK